MKSILLSAENDMNKISNRPGASIPSSGDAVFDRFMKEIFGIKK